VREPELHNKAKTDQNTGGDAKRAMCGKEIGNSLIVHDTVFAFAKTEQ
jgi:hypothetical protein